MSERFTDRQRAATAQGAAAISAFDHLVKALLEMGLADREAAAQGVEGRCCDLLAEEHFPAWRVGPNRSRPANGRQQLAALRIPDPHSENGTLWPPYGRIN